MHLPQPAHFPLPCLSCRFVPNRVMPRSAYLVRIKLLQYYLLQSAWHCQVVAGQISEHKDPCSIAEQFRFGRY